MSNCSICYGCVTTTQEICPIPGTCLCAPHNFVKSEDSVVECGASAFTPFPANSIESNLCGTENLVYTIESMENATGASINASGITYTSVSGTGRKLFKIVYSIRCGKYGTYGSVSGYYKDECAGKLVLPNEVCDPCTGLIEGAGPDLSISSSEDITPNLEITP